LPSSNRREFGAADAGNLAAAPVVSTHKPAWELSTLRKSFGRCQATVKAAIAPELAPPMPC
jgi:hypothetical protein